MDPILPQIRNLSRFLKSVQKEPHQTCSILSILRQKVLFHQESCVFETFAADLTSDVFVLFRRVSSWCPSFCKAQILEILVILRLKSLSPRSSSFLLKLSIALIIFIIAVWMFSSFNFDLKMWVHKLFFASEICLYDGFYFSWNSLCLFWLPVKVWP